ncbi:MAG: hypothetical protein JNL02_09620 [Saprospiraceae bacterium]|nr:hypothetical protein [Saprospiraceae bacterium]
MANDTQNGTIFRDGTSQRQRLLPALAPTYFSVEEHSTEDQLRFAREFAKTLKFFNLNNQEEGDWSGLLGNDDQLIADIFAFIDNPAAFDHDPAKKAWLTRPHLSLFLQFLDLLKGPRAQFDDLTRRHLEHYYREVLRFGPKPWKPDRVHVLFEPAKGTGALTLPQGALLQAGKDAKGKFLHYQTLFETVVNQARVVDIRQTFLVPERNDAGAPVNANAGMLYASSAWQEGQESQGKFQALGADLPQKNLTSPTLAEVGFIIESPLFWLSGGGTREVYLILPTEGDNTTIWEAFRFEFSCAGSQWYVPKTKLLKATDLPKGMLPQNGDYNSAEVISFSIDFSEGAPDFAPPAYGAGFKHPVLRAILSQTNEVRYDAAFNALHVKKLCLYVVGNELSAPKIRNDQAVLNPKGPFEPFGTNPQKGSTFTFSHPELCLKPIQEIRMTVDWRGLPDTSNQYIPYLEYLESLDPKIERDLSFSVKLMDVSPVKVIIDAANQREISAANLNFPGALENLPDSNDPFDFPRRFELKLASELLHKIYPRVLLWCANKDNKCTKPVPPPYTPAFQSFSIGYTSFAEIVRPEAGFYHIHPFGTLTASPIKNNEDSLFFRLLPFYKEDGCLYIGIDGFGGASDLNLLFQMWPRLSEQTEKMPEVALCYLKDDRWQKLDGQVNILYDATKQLFQTGLMRLRLPEVSSLAHRTMPSGLYWLRAESFAGFADATGDIVAVHAQAMEAEFVNRDNTLEHLQRPLPPDSIKSLVLRNPLIKSLRQPYTSFGGRPEEAPERLYTRVSERLRHKQRALTAWDYERLVLEHFPEVYKVKCLLPWELSILDAGNSAGAARRAPLNPAAGAVTLVVIPDISNAAPSFPMEPRAPRALLNDIALFLADYTSPFAKITVKNPRYEYVRYRMDIRFHQDYGPDIYLHETNEALKRHLSPWAYEQGADIPFGSRIYHSEVIYFLEKLPYVDYVLNFKLILHQTGNEKPLGCLEPALWVGADCPDAVLITHPKHIIWSVFGQPKSDEKYKGIGYDIIGVDHKVEIS